MQTRVDLFFGRDVKAFDDRMSKFQQSLDPAAPASKDAAYLQLRDILHDVVEACRRLESIIDCDEDLLRATQRRFYEATAKWFYQSWIGQRALTKPRGYPGDYLLLNTIYDQVPKSPGLGGYLDLYIMDLLLAQSVRARWQAMRGFLIDELSQRVEGASVLNVACGPCREYVGGMPSLEGIPIRVTCLDNDQEALDYVAAKIHPQAPQLQIRGQRYNALRMKSAEATVRLFGPSDIIYSIGLCDYLTDDAMIAILEGWRKSLSDDGVLLVAFKDTRRYDATPYQWLLDWHFFQRTEEDCRMLFELAGFNMAALEMTRDATGVIMNFISHAAAPGVVRFDPPHAAAAPLHLAPPTFGAEGATIDPASADAL